MAIDYSNPFLQSLGNVRTQPQQNQFMQPQQDFSGWGDRLNKIEKGIAGLTEQFSNFQAPGDVEPEYTGNAAPEPLEQSANIPEPLPLSSVAEPTTAPMGGQAQQAQSPFGMGGGQALTQSRYMTYQPGQEGFTPLTAEQFSSQKDLWGKRQDYSKFASMAGDVAGLDGGIGGLWGKRRQSLLGGDPRFGHAYESWQDYAAGYGGSDPSQGMENWMQDYNFDLAPERPQWQPGAGGSLQSGMADYQQSMQEYESSPEYLEWKQRQEARGPLSESTTQAMGGQNYMGGPPDIDPFISMGLGSPTATPTYEGYMDMVNRGRESYRPQSTATSPNFASPGGIYQQQLQPALQGPVQQQIQQGLGSLGAGI
jgi:hypothetical protein